MDKPRVWVLSPEAVRDMAAALGHHDLLVRGTRAGRFLFQCSCGHVSSSRTFERQATQLAIAHLESAIKRFQASGRPWPKLRDTPLEQTSESMPASVA
jgi:hypothetical protein